MTSNKQIQAARRAPVVNDTRARYSGSIQELKQYASEDVDAMVHICNKHIGNVPKGFFLAMQECSALVGRAPAVPVPQGLREAAQRAHDWMDSQADSQSKGNYHSFDLLCLRRERDALAEALAAAPQPPEAKNSECWCESCRPQSLTDMRFIVCPDCGNKRCPKANNHANACTNSNAPGQKGSSWERVKPFAQSPAPQPADAAPVQLPEPVCFALYDSQGFYEARDTEQQCVDFCKHYNERDARLGGGLAPYTYGKLYTEQQVRQLLEAHGITQGDQP